VLSPAREQSTKKFLQRPPQPHLTRECGHGEQQGQSEAGDQMDVQWRVLLVEGAGSGLRSKKRPATNGRPAASLEL
jgi:hypothetical protein